MDERLLRETPGVAVLQVARIEVARAIFAHATRRLGARGFGTISVLQLPSGPLFVEVARRLGMAFDDLEPTAFAERLASKLRAHGFAVMGPLPRPDGWDEAVAAELAGRGVPVLFWARLDARVPQQVDADPITIPSILSDDDARRWLSAAADVAPIFLQGADVDDAEERLAALRSPATPAAPLGGSAEQLLRRLTLVERGWPVDKLEALQASSTDVDALIAHGSIAVEHGFLSVLRPVEAGVTQQDLEVVASGLATFQADPWALARGAVLALRSGNATNGDAWIETAMQLVHGEARSELTRPWLRALEESEVAERHALMARAASRALSSGDCEEALRLANRASGGAAVDDASLSILVARAAAATGDLVQARLALEHAQQTLDRSPHPEHREQVDIELAELAYLVGDHDQAASRASHLADTALSPNTRLAARSVEGKVMLALGKYEAAERLFAQDAMTAAQANLATPLRRARLNRAIALMMLGRLVEARSLFMSVLEEGERDHDEQACAYALENLAYLATRELAYGTALAYAEKALVLRQRHGDRIRIVRQLFNLATVRRTLGLLSHADHSLRFATRLLGPGMPFHASPRLGIACARLALDQGRVGVATQELRRIAREAVNAKDGGRAAAEVERIQVRIALENGDIPAARAALEAASVCTADLEARWELSFLTAQLARAEGTLDESTLAPMLTLARQLGDYEFLCESLVFACEVHLGGERVDTARFFFEEARALRDRVASDLVGEVHEAFAGQRLSRALDGLGQRLAREASRLRTESELLDDAPPVTIRSTNPPPARQGREIIGEDPAIRSLRMAIKRVARSDATVLIRGESGTGKELVAEALHRASDRALGPMVTVNCAALVETLLLSELFGHEKGAFTGAAARRRGRFELAEGGTLFLDEIGDISPRTQVALLRVLQEKTFERVGGTTSIRANVRIVCATHRDLRAMVERGEFREDLYYRLRGITLEVPALRARIGDLPAIANNLLSRIAVERGEDAKALAPSAIELLQRHRWSGNVRELENALRAASLFADGTVIEVTDFTENVDDLRPLATPSLAPPAPHSMAPASLASVTSIGGLSRPTLPSLPTPEDSGELEVELTDDEDSAALPAGETGATAVAYACVRQGSVSLGDLKRQIERDCVARALAETKGNITRAAALLGMKRPRLSQLVKQYGLAAISEGS